MAIDIGAEASDRGKFAPSYFTFIALDNPANESGHITDIEIYAVEGYDLSGCKVGTFYEGETGHFTCRDYATIGDVEAGEKRTFSSLSIDCIVGDYIGIYFSEGQIEADSPGYAGLRRYSGDAFDAGEQEYYLLSGYTMSLYGYGIPVTYKIDGYTRDSAGDILGGCTVDIFLASDESKKGSVISDAGTGLYEFTGLSSSGPYYLRAFKSGSPDVFGTTKRTVSGVEE